MGLKAGDLNLYRYVDNSPVKKSDPTGKLSPASVTFCVVSIAAGALYDSVRAQISLMLIKKRSTL